jgi:hypothetical protein
LIIFQDEPVSDRCGWIIARSSGSLPRRGKFTRRRRLRSRLFVPQAPSPQPRTPKPAFDPIRSAVIAHLSAVIAGFRAVVAGFRTVIADFRAVVADFRATVADFQAAVADFRATVADFRAVVADLRAAISGFRAVVAGFRAVVADATVGFAGPSTHSASTDSVTSLTNLDVKSRFRAEARLCPVVGFGTTLANGSGSVLVMEVG